MALKSIGVAVLMAQSGLPVAADRSAASHFSPRAGGYRRSAIDSGEPEHLFRAHRQHPGHGRAWRTETIWCCWMKSAPRPSPMKARRWPWPFWNISGQNGATTLVTTHHSRLKAYAAETPQAVNAAMEFDEATLQPTYRLISGLPGKSSGIDTAERLGLAPSIVEQARALMPVAEAEASALVATLHEQKTDLENRARELDRERMGLEARRAELEKHFDEDRRKKLRELDKRLEQTLKQYEEKWEAAVAQIRAQAAARGQAASLGKKAERKAAAVRSETREEWNAQVLETLGAAAEPGSLGSQFVVPEQAGIQAPPAVGNRVRIPNIATPGTVTALVGNDQIEVEVGRLRMRVGKDEVQVLAPAEDLASRSIGTGAGPKSGGTGATWESEDESPREINVIGTTADEARELVDKFLDSSFLAGRSRLRVVHGHGKGILMRSLHEMFASHPHVEKFYAAPQNEGGTGATIVELKQ